MTTDSQSPEIVIWQHELDKRDSEFEPVLIASDAIGQESDGWCHPYIVFDPAEGRMTIADDYETVNDVTARDCILTKADAIRLATKLLDYAMYGTTSTTKCVSRGDVEKLLEEERLER
jgi:hypothetical protein